MLWLFRDKMVLFSYHVVVMSGLNLHVCEGVFECEGGVLHAKVLFHVKVCFI